MPDDEDILERIEREVTEEFVAAEPQKKKSESGYLPVHEEPVYRPPPTTANQGTKKHIAFYYPTSGGTVSLQVGSTEFNFIDGKISTPDGKTGYLSARLSGSEFSHIGAIYISADKNFSINIDGLAEMEVNKNFRKKHINIQRIAISVTSATQIQLWASTDPDAELIKDVSETTVTGAISTVGIGGSVSVYTRSGVGVSVSPIGQVVDSDDVSIDPTGLTVLATRTIGSGKIYRLTKAQFQCASAAHGIVVSKGATVAVFRVPDDGYWVDWFPYGDALKLIVGSVISMKARTKQGTAVASGLLIGDE